MINIKGLNVSEEKELFRTLQGVIEEHNLEVVMEIPGIDKWANTKRLKKLNKYLDTYAVKVLPAPNKFVLDFAIVALPKRSGGLIKRDIKCATAGCNNDCYDNCYSLVPLFEEHGKVDRLCVPCIKTMEKKVTVGNFGSSFLNDSNKAVDNNLEELIDEELETDKYVQIIQGPCVKIHIGINSKRQTCARCLISSTTTSTLSHMRPQGAGKDSYKLCKDCTIVTVKEQAAYFKELYKVLWTYHISRDHAENTCTVCPKQILCLTRDGAR